MARERRSWPSAQGSICEVAVFPEVEEPVVFNPNNDKYLCLCGHAHCVTGVRLVICLLGFTLVIEFYELCVALAYPRGGKLALPVSTCTNLLLGGFLTTCLVISLRFVRAAFLLPYLIMQAAGLISTVVFTVAFCYMAIWEDRKMAHNFGVVIKGDDSPSAPLWLRAGTFFLMSVIQVWLISVVIGCWRYLRDLKRPHLAIDVAAAEAVMHGLRRSVSAEAIDRRPRKHRIAVRSISESNETDV